MGQYEYLACNTPNRTRQAILVVAYIMMAVLAVSAAFAVAGEDQPQPQSWAATSQPEVVKFTSFRTGREIVVPLQPAENLEILTKTEVIAGLRIIRRMDTRYVADVLHAHHGRVSQGTIVEALNEVLHHGDTWAVEELETLREVLAETYPHITVF